MRANFALDYDVLTVEQPQKLYLMAYLTAGPAPKDRQRRPLNLSLVIDRSGSMAGDKIDYTRQAAQLLVQNLSVNDVFSIILYNDNVETLLMPERVQRKDVINQQIRNIKPGGTTNLSGGWLEGCNLVTQNLDNEHINRVILMSDGLANRGVTSTDKLVTMAQQKRGEGVTTTTMGLGSDFNEDLLMQMANAGGGAFYFIESPEVAPLIFQEELQGLLSVVGQNLIISVEKTDYVTQIVQLNSYPVQNEGKRSSFRLGDIFGDEIKALLLELTIPGLKEIGQRQIATLKFEYDELSDNTTTHRVWELPVSVNVKMPGEVPLLPNPEVRKTVMLLKAAQARRTAIESADKGRYQEAAKALREAVKLIDDSGIVDTNLAEERQALLQQADDMEKGAVQYNEYSRKMMATQSFYTMQSRHDETVILREREQMRQPATESKTSATPPAPPPSDLPPMPPSHVSWQDKTFPLAGDIIRIGRSTHNEIVIGAKGVSRFHCQVKRNGELFYLEDVGSTNGTTINGTLLSGQHLLRVGDEVKLCDEKLVFHDGSYQRTQHGS